MRKKTAFLSGTSKFFGPSYFVTALGIYSFYFSVFHVPDYAILSYPDEPNKSPSNHNLDESKSRYTFVTANLLLGIESLGKFQNMPFVYSRLQKITDSFMNINKCVLLV